MYFQIRTIICLLLAALHWTVVHGDHTAAAMTTVLARPLGGYGLSPLIFEPSSSMLGLSSDAIETKVRKSPVFELIMPNYDEENIHTTLPVTEMPITTKSKKLDYESMISKSQPDKTISSPSSHSYFSANNMLDLFRPKDNSMYGDSIPSYKEQIDRSDYGKATKSSSYGGSGGSYGGPTGPVSAAIQSVRSVEVKPVQDTYQNNEPQIIDIPPSALPIVINFRTSSSQIQIHQSHETAEPGEVQQTQSEDEPHYLKHQVTKPVIQEVHEIIVPYRKIIQEIRPVEEEIKTIVARSSGRDKSNRAKGGGGSGEGKYSSGGGSGGYNGPRKSVLGAGQNSKYKS